MKTLQLNMILNGIRAKVDGSLGLTFSTPELTVEEKAEVMRLQSTNLLTLLKPTDMEAPVLNIEKETDTKTPGQRLRNTLYVWWKQMGENGDFEDFYKQKMEGFINAVKEKLSV